MKTKQWLFIPTLLVIGIVVLSYFAYNQIVTSTTLSEKEIETRIAALYGGDVQTITKKGTQYNVTFAVDDYIYEVVANEDYGMFEQLAVIKEGTPPEKKKPDAPTERPDTPIEAPIPSQEPVPETKPTLPNKERLTQQQVITIAKKQARGTIDDIEFFATNDGGSYIVDMENDDDDDDDVSLQIHAITGKVLSVSFDD